MPVAFAEAGADERLRALQVDQFERQIFREALAVTLLERRTGEDDILALRVQFRQLGVNCVEPRPTVSIRQWNSVVHFGHIFGRMKIIGLEKHPSQPLGNESADGALSGAGHSHDEKYHSRSHEIGRAEFRALRAASPAMVR